MNVGSLFSGIGGLDLGLERAGMHIRWQCEIDPYCRAVLKHHWPNTPRYSDIKTIDSAVEPVDLICGGFPCQPVSVAGRGKAQEDPRWLWPEMARVVGLLQPRWVLVENVPGLVKRGLRDVVTGLAEMGYDAEWEIVSAASCGASQLRERLFVVAHTGREPEGAGERDDDTSSLWGRQAALVAGRSEVLREHWASEPGVGRVAYGVPNRVAQLRALGNAVVPQVAETVGRMIMEAA
jgi:DNA (cytosine-5)-methyltransferase 1